MTSMADRIADDGGLTPDRLKTPEQLLYSQRMGHAIQEAYKGNFQPGIDMGLYPEGTTAATWEADRRREAE